MTAPAASIESEVRKLETKYWEAIRSGNSEALTKMTAEPFTFVMKEGATNFSRPDFVKMMIGDDFKMTAFKLDEGAAVFRQLGPDVAMLAYPGHWEFERSGKLEKHDTVNTSTWVRDGTTWKCAVVTEADQPR